MRILLLGNNNLSRRVWEYMIARREDALVSMPWVEPVNPDDVEGYDLGISAGYTHIIRQPVLDKLKILNLHPSYLPWNRGKYPNVWPLLDNTPAGVTIHWMDAGMDTGPLVAQERVPTYPWDTAVSLYQRLEDRLFELFTTVWPVRALASGIPQRGIGSVHYARELDSVSLELDSRRPVREVLAILRARTYPGYPGVRFTENGETWEVTVQCRKVDA